MVREVQETGEDAQRAQRLNQALESGVCAYFNECRARVGPFIRLHFRCPGAWHTNRKALGWDLLRSPCNLFWAPVYVLAMLLAWAFGRMGWRRLAAWLARTPAGFTTAVQRHIGDLIYTDLLQRSPAAGTDRLEQHLAAAVAPLADDSANRALLAQRLEPLMHDALTQYATTRTASADITNSLLSTLAGAFAFKKFTPGGLAVGVYIAGAVSYHLAVNEFWFGDTLGRIYYELFPPMPSPLLSTVSVVAVLALLAVFASFSGLIIDPIQSWSGLHRRRLNTMLDSLERDLINNLSSGSFRPRDAFVARVFELIDAAKSQVL